MLKLAVRAIFQAKKLINRCRNDLVSSFRLVPGLNGCCFIAYIPPPWLNFHSHSDFLLLFWNFTSGNIILYLPAPSNFFSRSSSLPCLLKTSLTASATGSGYLLCLHQISCQTHELSYISIFSFLGRLTEIILIFSARYVMIPDQCLPEIFPITKNLFSSLTSTGISIKSGSSHNSWAL